MEHKLFFEIIGYSGTILVILSMMMTSLIKLRVINMCGSIFSMIYAIISNTLPIVLMNGALFIINLIQLIRSLNRDLNFSYKKVSTNELCFKHFIEVYINDITKYFKDLIFIGMEEVYLVFIDTELVGILVGTTKKDTFDVLVDYAIPKYRDMSIGKYLYPILKKYNVSKIIQKNNCNQHIKYLLLIHL